MYIRHLYPMFSIPSLLLSLPLLVSAQTYSSCNPLYTTGCPANSALGRSVSIDFTQGQSDSFTPSGGPTFSSDGAHFTISQSGNSPVLSSRWYIMFGRITAVVKAAPGQGIVSSAILQSDTLDEIDFEWIGSDGNQVQTNYFGKGATPDYNRGTYASAPGATQEFHTYTIDWNADRIVWQVDGTTIRTLTSAAAAAGQYPQTPMQVKVGAWSGGDPSNAPGTISWAGGPTNYANGPFTMIVKSIDVEDYSTGSQYKYQGTSGTWQDIEAVGGSVNPQGTGSGSIATSAPATITTVTGATQPMQTLFPWQRSASQSTVTYTNYPGLPSGWTVTSSGKVLPPSGAPRERSVGKVLLTTGLLLGMMIIGLRI